MNYTIPPYASELKLSLSTKKYPRNVRRAFSRIYKKEIYFLKDYKEWEKGKVEFVRIIFIIGDYTPHETLSVEEAKGFNQALADQLKAKLINELKLLTGEIKRKK